MWIGARQAAINVAEGRKQATILASEAEKSEQINKASGEAEAILLRAQASAKGIEKVALAIGQMNGKDAVSMTVAEKYVDAFGRMAKEGTTMIVPASANDAASMVAQVKRIGDIGYILSLTWILFFLGIVHLQLYQQAKECFIQHHTSTNPFRALYQRWDDARFGESRREGINIQRAYRVIIEQCIDPIQICLIM